jgi:RimJ/RimL family protein N-acetyltransferase
MGHLMRVLAIAERALLADWDVTIVGDLDERAQGLVATHCRAASCVSVPLAGIPRWIETELDPATNVLHLDTYWLDTVPPTPPGCLVSSIQDGVFGQRRADLAIDPNLGAETRIADHASDHYLLGITAVAIRGQVLARRGEAPEAGRSVLVVLGGTDPHGVTPQVVDALGAVPGPLRVTVVVPAGQVDAVEAAVLRSPHAVERVSFLDDLPAVAREHTLVLTAAGTSVWDLACLGVPMATVCVADNQREGYQAVVAAGLGVGLGEPDEGFVARIAAVGDLLDDAAHRASMSATGRSLVDGLGTWRIVAAWSQLSEVAARQDPRRLTARPATMTDARLLFDWRNDPTTRASSRHADELDWDTHVQWLDGTLRRSDRILLIIGDGSVPVGTIRWDREDDRTWEVSVTVAPEARGQGIALAVLQAGERALAVPSTVRLVAVVHDDNDGSRRLFARAGYLPHLPADEHGFATYARWQVAAPELAPGA